jgi:hypothetical protein
MKLKDIMAAVSSYGSSYWAALDKQTKEIKGFLKSLSPERIGNGLVLYDPARFILTPRSAYWSSSLSPRAVCTINFENTQTAFRDLLAKCNAFQEQIEKFMPAIPEDYSVQSKGILRQLIAIEKLINEVSRPALKQLTENSSNSNNPENAQFVSVLNEKILPKLTSVKKIFIDKLVPLVPSTDSPL